MENNKTLIPIENFGFSGNYYYYVEHNVVYSINSDLPLFDFYTWFGKNNFDLKTQLKICQEMLYAYEMGVNKQKQSFKNKVNELFDL